MDNVFITMMSVFGLMVTLVIIVYATMWLISSIADFVDSKKAEKLHKAATEIEQRKAMQEIQYMVSQIWEHIKEQRENPNLRSFPDLGSAPEQIDVTVLSDKEAENDVKT